MKRPRRSDPAPVETDGVTVVAVGTALWALAFLVLLPGYPRLAAAGQGWVLWTCAVGVALGLLGIAVLRRRRR